MIKNLAIFLFIMTVCCSCSNGKDPDGYGDSEAAKWLRMAAEDGVVYAQYYYAECCLDGDGTKVDAAEAVKYLRSAAGAGHHQAMFLLGKCYRDGRGVKPSEKEARKYFEAAAEKGNADAKAALLAMKRAARAQKR